MMEKLHRVVITGLGAITPIGNNLESYLQGLLSGRNGVDQITLFDASSHACRFAAEVKSFDPTGKLEQKNPNDGIGFQNLESLQQKKP